MSMLTVRTTEGDTAVSVAGVTVGSGPVYIGNKGTISVQAATELRDWLTGAIDYYVEANKPKAPHGALYVIDRDGRVWGKATLSSSWHRVDNVGAPAAWETLLRLNGPLRVLRVDEVIES